MRLSSSRIVSHSCKKDPVDCHHEDLRNGRCDETQPEGIMSYDRPLEQQKMASSGLLSTAISALCIVATMRIDLITHASIMR